MTPKKRKRLKWVVDSLRSGRYCIVNTRGIGWSAYAGSMVLADAVTKRQAINECEKYFNQKGPQ